MSDFQNLKNRKQQLKNQQKSNNYVRNKKRIEFRRKKSSCRV